MNGIALADRIQALKQKKQQTQQSAATTVSPNAPPQVPPNGSATLEATSSLPLAAATIGECSVNTLPSTGESVRPPSTRPQPVSEATTRVATAGSRQLLYRREPPTRYTSAQFAADVSSFLRATRTERRPDPAVSVEPSSEGPISTDRRRRRDGDRFDRDRHDGRRKRSRDESGSRDQKQRSQPDTSPMPELDIPFLGSHFGGSLNCAGEYRASAGSVERYLRGKLISEGVYGKVYEGTEEATNTKRALKQIISKWLEKSEVGFPHYLMKEFDLVMRINHRNVVRGLELTYGRKQDGSSMVFMVMELALRDLKGLIYSKCLHLSSSRFNDRALVDRTISRVKCIIKQILEGLAFLHEHHILHRDLKCSNVLVDAEGTVKLCDFGLACLYQDGQHLDTNVVTLLYRAPELHLGIRDYTSAVDVWSAGCIFFECLRTRPLFRGADEFTHFTSLCDTLGELSESEFPGVRQLPNYLTLLQKLPPRLERRRNVIRTDPELLGGKYGALLSDAGYDFLSGMLKWNPKDRLTAAEALAHPYLTREAPLPCDPRELNVPLLDPRYDSATSSSTAALTAPGIKDCVFPAEAPQPSGNGGQSEETPIQKPDKTPSRVDLRLDQLHDEGDAIVEGADTEKEREAAAMQQASMASELVATGTEQEVNSDEEEEDSEGSSSSDDGDSGPVGAKSGQEEDKGLPLEAE